nr:NADH dehydrogenase subunit 2 [Aphidius gifuensis]
MLIFNMKYNWLFIFMLFISPLLVISMNSWFSIWINMELNLMMFIVYLMLNNIYIYDLCMKYFLVNSFSSMLFIFMMNFLLFYYNNMFFLMIINISMMLKLGMMPFHFWFIDLMMNLNWISNLIISTWQKIIPFFILMFIYLQNLVLMFILISSIFSMIFSMNQIYLKKIYAYSSINHMCWLLMSLIFSELIWMMYFFIYVMINLLLMFMLKIFNINYLMDLFYKFSNKYMKIFFMFLMFSLGGLPPFLGFIMKWYLIFYLINNYNFFILLILIFFSLIFLFFYLRMLYMNMFINYTNFNLMKFYTIKLNFNIILIMNFMIMFLSIFVLYFYI